MAPAFMPYSDTLAPRVFANASPLDPQLFSTIAEHADDLLAGRANPKYSPAEVAAWLDAIGGRRPRRRLAELGTPASRERRRLVEDVAIQIGIGRFLCRQAAQRACISRSGRKSSDRRCGAAGAERLSGARASLGGDGGAGAKAVYAADISYGADSAAARSLVRPAGGDRCGPGGDAKPRIAAKRQARERRCSRWWPRPQRRARCPRGMSRAGAFHARAPNCRWC